MRWIWLDRITELKKAERCVAIRAVTWGEDVLHDHFPSDPANGKSAIPCMPHSLVIEGMAQTAGILAGHASDFKEKVILAKIGRAVFEPGVLATPGTTIRHTAVAERLDSNGAVCTGTVELIDTPNGRTVPFAQIDLMFSHVDQNRQGLEFPEHNFVFTEQFMSLLDISGIARPAGKQMPQP